LNETNPYDLSRSSGATTEAKIDESFLKVLPAKMTTKTTRCTLGPIKKHAIAYSSIMASGKSDWLTREEVMDEMNSFLTYDTVELFPFPTQDRNGTVWYGFRLMAVKEGKPERIILLYGEEETLKAKDSLYVDTLYYFEDKNTYQFVWDHWTKETRV
jgi:hypothetical protein